MRVLLLTGLMLLGGCAGFGRDAAKGCSGPTRPANPNGSVLISAPSPTAPAPQAANPSRTECR